MEGAKERRKGRRCGRVEERKSQEQRNADRCTVLVQEGQYTRGLQALASAGMAEHNAATIREMQAKHPPAARVQPPLPTTNISQLAFNKKEVLQAAQSFRKGSAPGPSGKRPEHLKGATKASPGTTADRALQALTKLVNAMAAGRVPASVAPYLCGARLHAARKKDFTIRPIAVGNLLRRLAAKCFSSALANKAAALLAPHQLGVGVRGGCEAITHAVREAVEQDPSLWVLQADLVNAFNLQDRGNMLEETARHFPECLSWVVTCYGAPSFLQFGETRVTSDTGVHQGDPLAGLLFSGGLQPVVEAIEEEVPTLVLNSWFYDDGHQVGTKEELMKVVDIILREGRPRGLILSTAATVSPPSLPKTTVWSPGARTDDEEQDPLQRRVPRVSSESGITVLGAPVGSEQYVKEVIESRVEKIREVTGLLRLVKDPHCEFVLLRSCLELPKVMFLLRSLDTTPYGDLLEEFDSITRGALGCSIPNTWTEFGYVKTNTGCL